MHIWIQNDPSFSKLFEISKLDEKWQVNNPTLLAVWNAFIQNWLVVWQLQLVWAFLFGFFAQQIFWNVTSLCIYCIAKVFSSSKFIPQCCTNINDEDDILSHLTISLKATVLHYSSIRYTLFTLSGYIASSYLVLQYLYLSSWQFPLCTNVLHILHCDYIYIDSLSISVPLPFQMSLRREYYWYWECVLSLLRFNHGQCV